MGNFPLSLHSVLSLAIILVILGVFVISCFFFLRPLNSVKKDFADGIKALKTQDKNVADHFPNSLFHDEWLDFKKEYEARRVTIGGKAYSVIDVDDFFSPAVILHSYNRGMALSVAGILTGIAIFGTFLGLTMGIGGVNTKDPALLMTGINSLLEGMKIAFLGGVFGVAASIFWLFLERLCHHAAIKNLREFNRLVKKLYPSETNESILLLLSLANHHKHESIKEGNALMKEIIELEKRHLRYARSNKTTLQTLGQDLAGKLEGAMDVSLRPHLEAMTARMSDFTGNVGNMQMDAMQEMVHSFKDNLSGTLNKDFLNLSETIHNVITWQEQVHGRLESLVQALMDSTESQNMLIANTNNAIMTFNGGIENFNISRETMDSVLVNITSLSDVTLSAAIQVERQLSEMTTRLSSRAEQLDSEIEMLTAANAVNRQDLQNTIRLLDGQVETLKVFYDSVRQDFSNVAKELKESTNEFNIYVAEKVRGTFEEFDTQMSSISQHLSGTISEIRDTTEDLPASIASLRDGIKTSLQPVERAHDDVVLVSTSIDNLRQTLSRFEETMEAVKNTQQWVVHYLKNAQPNTPTSNSSTR